MGIVISLLQNFGFPGVQSLSTDKVFNKYFKDVDNFDKFHAAFLKVCNDFNAVMPGKHFSVPEYNKIKNWYDNEAKWNTLRDDQKKQLFKEYMTNPEHVFEVKSSQSAMLMTGMVAPAAAMVLKRSGENLPQLKKFHLHLIPNFAFVPSFTLLAVIGVKVLQVNASSR